MAKAGTGPLLAPGIIKTASFIVVAPLLGMLLSGIIIVALSWICRRRTQRQTDRWFRKLQLVSSAMYSIGHGSNDAQKTMGIIWLLLISGEPHSPDHLPNWVVISCYVTIAFGTLFGGWRIVKTMGQRITKLKPIGGFAAETGGRDLAVHGDVFRHPGVHDAHDHRLDHRRRQRAARAGRALGRRRQHHRCVGRDDPGLGADRGSRLVARMADLPVAA